MPDEEHPNNTQGWSRHAVGLGLLGISLFAGLILFAFIAQVVPKLPYDIALNFTNEGYADQSDSQKSLFYLPLLGALIWLLNTLVGLGLARKRNLRVGAHLLWANTLAVQIILWVAALRLVGTI